MRAVRAVPKCVEHKNIAEAGQLFCKLRIVCRFSLWKRRFSSSTTCPASMESTASCASLPNARLLQRSLWCSKISLSRFATGASEKLAYLSLRRPRWDIRITFAPWSRRYWIVGSAALIRVSSVISPIFVQRNVKIHAHEHLLPWTSISSIVFS